MKIDRILFLMMVLFAVLTFSLGLYVGENRRDCIKHGIRCGSTNNIIIKSGVERIWVHWDKCKLVIEPNPNSKTEIAKVL